MNRRDDIGRRGESIFTVLITNPCDGGPLFRDVFLGEKHEATDFEVELSEASSGHAHFYVQVKSTTNRYTGQGDRSKIDVRVSKKDVEKLKRVHAPVYVVGVDVDNIRGYVKGITQQTVGGISGIATRNILDCDSLGELWEELDEYWNAKSILARDSRFS